MMNDELKPLPINGTEYIDHEEIRFGGNDTVNGTVDELKPISDLPVNSSRSAAESDFVPLQGTVNISDIKNKDSNYIFFFGTAQSGKSVILSSMLYALRTKFGVIRPQKGTPNSREAMVLLSDFFENIRRGILPGRTVRDQVTRMDLVFEPNNKSKKVGPVNLTFLEASGENHNEIRRGGNYHGSIAQYLKANIPMTFILVTGYNSAHNEDSILNEFLYLLEHEGKNLRNINLILVVSKWDKSGNQAPSEEELDYFVKERLPMTYQFLETNSLAKTFYTVGQLENTGGEDKIVALSLDSAELLSKWLYKNIAGQSLDYEGGFWEQFKWSLGKK
ncbi:hypothetical protein P0M11_01135 [Kaistella sp. PBT33-4]|uniref:hypothetical protein n=1 Tax=Kaistella sp. PBT33-4 TaxID=3032000 RepID=UPI0023D7C275|nr:hypothetical protein [Kaistella sp. PBT33-4]MDF0718594.1 hypothetical protein [Kaistella sp. PBT33-4]